MVESANAKEAEIAEADVPADLHESELLRRERGLASSWFFQGCASDVRTNGISRNERREGVQGGVSQSVRHGQTHKVTVTTSNNGRRRQRRVEND